MPPDARLALDGDLVSRLSLSDGGAGRIGSAGCVPKRLRGVRRTVCGDARPPVRGGGCDHGVWRVPSRAARTGNTQTVARSGSGMTLTGQP